MKFMKGITYVIYSGTKGHWYLVKQVGMKSWIAMNFTNVDISEDKEFFRGNAQSLWADLKPRDDFKECRQNKELRHAMFDVLKYGYFKD